MIRVIDCPDLGTVKVLVTRAGKDGGGIFALEIPKDELDELIEKLEAVR